MLYNVFFSANGRTGICADFVAGLLANEAESYNWLWEEYRKPLKIKEADTLLFAMPVYGGYIPSFCAELVKNLVGNNTPAIIMAVYGNRHFDNALIQAKDLLQTQGFKVIAAGAFVAEHSIFPKVGFGRPNVDDYKAMETFADKCKELLKRRDCLSNKEIKVYGDKECKLIYSFVPSRYRKDKDVFSFLIDILCEIAALSFMLDLLAWILSSSLSFY